MIDYKDLKNGDVILLSNQYVDNRIAIVNKVEKSVLDTYKLFTYVEFEDDFIYFEKEEPGYSYDVNHCSFKYATEEEKLKLYNAIGKHFTEEYDKDWYNHFTDSSFFDIQDYLLYEFNIEVVEYDDDLIYPGFINDIQIYIWKKCCEAIGIPDGLNEGTDLNYNDKRFLSSCVNEGEKIISMTKEERERAIECITLAIELSGDGGMKPFTEKEYELMYQFLYEIKMFCHNEK